ncbi:hypothetical protein EYV94_18075 [Puteibacter caeruleilacunae]|nr:hypothetical protein EYV94_18075 [Puteibacter caeruleilacunae]
MKGILLMVFALVLSISGHCQSENEIYNKIIQDYVLKNLHSTVPMTSELIIVENTLTMGELSVDDYLKFKKQYGKLKKETFIDFTRKSSDCLNADDVEFPEFEAILVSKEQGKNRKNIAEAFPNWNGLLIELSNIGFNVKRDQAFLYYAFDSGRGAAGGAFLIYEKKKNEWFCKTVIPAWAM